MLDAYDLSRLEPSSFEHLVNLIAIRVLGAGTTGFAPGADGGRDGYFEGEAPYPSETNRWTGEWYIQSKFHKPHLSADPQKWLLDRIKEELNAFSDSSRRRTWPDNWIIATNIDPTGVPETGSFDKARSLVKEVNPTLAERFHIWGGKKILDLLALNSQIAEYYGDFLTPGSTLSAIYHQICDAQADVKDVLRYLVLTRFIEQQYTKLEQSGSTTDSRPGIHRLFTDVPFSSYVTNNNDVRGLVLRTLTITSSQNHRVDNTLPNVPVWQTWKRHPRRARVWFIKGGPGQGKSTVTQYLAQIQRAALLLQPNGPTLLDTQRAIAEEFQATATEQGLWPNFPRIPVYIELRDFAQWFGARDVDGARGILTFQSERIAAQIGQMVQPGTIKRAFQSGRWLFVFDGLDEVPSDIKDDVADEIRMFVDDILIGCGADALSVCTSRPQGYSGQFASLDAATIDLIHLSEEQALACAKPVLEIERTKEEASHYYDLLQEAISSRAVKELMTTPLQSHIMAVVVRDGGRPPERRWQLFTNFYQVIKRREANRNLPDKNLSRLIREGDQLLKALHNRIGFELHARAETSGKRAQKEPSIQRAELKEIVREVVVTLQDSDIDRTVDTLMEATTERLVLVSTPESGEEVRFDIRPLQEFFAAEFLYEHITVEDLRRRLSTISGDSHWSEVIHFLFSGLVENARLAELSVAVEVLGASNEHIGGQTCRPLARRLALGSTVSIRLLTEGVLEQDKRIRQLFRTSIEPLFGCLDAVEFLDLVEGTHSRSWLLDSLIEGVFEQSEEENIGAGSSLLRLLGNESSLVPEVAARLSRSSWSYQSTLIRILAHSFDPEDHPLSDWSAGWVLTRLMEDDWACLGSEGLDAAFALLSSEGLDLVRIGEAAGLPIEIASRLSAIFDADFYRSRDGGIREPSEDFGIVIVRYIKPRDALNVKLWSDADWAVFENWGGMFRVVAKLLKVVSNRLDMDSSIATIQDNWDYVTLLPSAVQSLVDGDIAVWKGAAKASEILAVLKDNSHRGYYRIIEIVEDQGDDVQKWISALKEYPRLVLHMLANGFVSGRRENNRIAHMFSPDEAQNAILHYFETDFRALSVFPIWGELLEVCSLVGDDLRSVMINLAESAESSPNDRIGTRIKPYILRLPEEASVLPLVAQTVLMAQSRHEESYLRFGELGARNVRGIVSEFIESPVVLLDIEKSHPSEDVRAAATILYILHPKAKMPARKILASKIDRFGVSETSFWYLGLAAYSVHDFVVAVDPAVVSALARLLHRSRANYPARWHAQFVLKSWREISRGPVQAAMGSRTWV